MDFKKKLLGAALAALLLVPLAGKILDSKK